MKEHNGILYLEKFPRGGRALLSLFALNGMNKNRWESRKSPILNKRRGGEVWGRAQSPAWAGRWGQMGLWSWAAGREAALGEAA